MQNYNHAFIMAVMDFSGKVSQFAVVIKNSKKGMKAGIWSRWSEYAINGHGGDIKLRELCSKNPKYAENYFQWSILGVLPMNVIPKVAIDRETKWKDKLLSREFGYNNN